ncbi:hypothetical protein [Rubrivirga sp. IMCC43871]|uniref:hypothetical protein n=1 Tax=Rubrivirga sp. IMCC43871 TaxID=3391575 RepID=UPI00398FED98
MRRVPALLLLAALVGGLSASAVHAAGHAADWAEGRAHQLAHHGSDGAQAPCVDGEAHALDCAVCSWLGSAVTLHETPALALADAADVSPEAVVFRPEGVACAPARGPPAVA